MKAVTVAGGSSDDPEIEAVTTALEGEPEASAEADAKPGSEAAPLADAEPVAGSELPGDADPETDSAPKAAAGPDDKAAADAEPEGETAPQAKQKDQAGSELPHDAEPKGETDPQGATESERAGKADAGLPGGTDPARSEAEAAAAEPKAETEPEGGSEADAKPEAETEAEHAADPKGEADPKSTTRSQAEATAAEPKADADPKGETGPQGAAESEHAGETDAGLPGGTDPARSEAEAAAAEPKAETEPEGGSEADAKPEAETEAEHAAGSKGEADPESTTRSRAQSIAAEPKADAEPKGEAESERAGEADAGLPGGTDSEGVKADTDAEANAEPEAEGGSERAGEARSEADAEPKAAGGIEAEAGVTARSAAEVDADGRLDGGDGGEPTAGDRADTGPEPEAAASDETMLITLPKQKPAEPDAPRKAPSWAREVEPDPERTSQFVALKDVDLPAPVAPRAQPQSLEAQVAGQAPAAPLPPLDLLAELTNTRPPAETPRRTALRRVKIWTPVLLLLVGAGAGAQLMRPLPAPQLVAAETDRTVDGQFSVPWPAKGQGAVRVSGSGDIGTFGEQKPVPTASVAKVMTAYVILKGHPLRKADPGPDITIDAKTVADGTSEHESRIRSLTPGQKFSQQDMLKMLMIPSGNNVARLLARWDTGTDSEAAFVAKMNAAAKELGMANTTYTDPSGLDAGTVSTAVDQLKLAEAVMKDEVFRSIVAVPYASIKGVPTGLENNNTLLSNTIRGIKTGSSTPAGGTLMWAAYRSIDGKDQLILGTLMDQRVDGPDEDGANSLKLVLANSKTIIEGVRAALASAPVIRKGDVVGHVDDGLGGRTPLVATKDLNVIGVPGQKLKLSLTTGDGAGAGPLPHTAKAGAEVAVLTVGSGEGARSVPVAVKGALVEPSFGTRLTRGR
ncbi:serine hydrolase [Streptomyces sp. NBC_01207]|uniref:serine hydrolase n=1 Tax=Streptomyces sp. NBC_01207 TaxID=2903772 RepID=UPI002E0EBA9F|nr:serine hydrolase [Streptomyces sp. NBC_01207]